MNNVRTILISLSLLCLISCADNSEKQKPSKEETEKIAFTICNALQNNDSTAFKDCFDSEGIKNVPEKRFKKMFKEYKEVISRYRLPEYEIWKKKRIYFNNDSLFEALRIGMPFSGDSISGNPDYYFRIKYTNKLKVISFTLTKVNAYQIPADSILSPK